MQAYKDLPINLAMRKAVYELNNRPRNHRKSPLQEAIEQQPKLEYVSQDSKNLVRDFTCLHRNRKDNTFLKKLKS